jgi:citrate lyase subunit beta-like protein
MHVRRALLYVPGDDPHKINKAKSLSVDSICLDLEDGVALNRKQEARNIIREFLSQFDSGASERLVRINPINTDIARVDLSLILPLQPDGIVIPKVETPIQIKWVSQQIKLIETENNWEPGKIAILAIVESAQGIINLAEIAEADRRLQALIFGAEDLAADIGARRTREASEVFYARSAVVLHAKAAGLQAIDLVCMDFSDLTRLRAETIQGLNMGYTGKQTIHPLQITVVQDIFTPTEAEIAEATNILLAYNKHLENGIGAFAIDGMLIDAPVIRAANNILERARTSGKLAT